MQGSTQADKGAEKYSATIDVQSIVKALELNATHGVDDRVIAVARKTGGTAKVRRAFKGGERYSNPETAPIHIRPESLVDDGWQTPPRRDDVDVTSLDVPNSEHDRDKSDEESIDKAHAELIDVWRDDVLGMVLNENTLAVDGHTVVVTGHN